MHLVHFALSSKNIEQYPNVEQRSTDVDFRVPMLIVFLVLNFSFYKTNFIHYQTYGPGSKVVYSCYPSGGQKKNFLITQITRFRTIVTMSMLVMGIYMRKVSRSIRMSPGRCPNQANLFSMPQITSPANIITPPARTRYFPISYIILENYRSKVVINQYRYDVLTMYKKVRKTAWIFFNFIINLRHFTDRLF